MSWWSSHYNRPLKDPLLASYTQEELAYEYFSILERKLAEEERIQAVKDAEEDKKLQENEDWADKMEKEEEERVLKAQEQKKISEEEQKWMEKHLNEGKQEFGESFGEDISIKF